MVFRHFVEWVASGHADLTDFNLAQVQPVLILDKKQELPNYCPMQSTEPRSQIFAVFSFHILRVGQGGAARAVQAGAEHAQYVHILH